MLNLPASLWSTPPRAAALILGFFAATVLVASAAPDVRAQAAPEETVQGDAAAKAADSAWENRRSSGLYGDVVTVGLRRTLVLITAFLIGMFGAAAFHLGVYTGFIARESRPGLLEFLHTEFANRSAVTQQAIVKARLLCLAFWSFGGIVAMVFQMADADSLVPIQAFVLGASWPTVVTQLMSGRNSPPPPQRADILPAAPPPPPGPAGEALGGAPGVAVPPRPSVEVIS